MRTAAYARYSSDMQSQASLEDQLRNCRTYCDRNGWPHPIVFTDAAMSGARDDRPGYQSLLAAAAERRFDVLLVDDLSRLSRDKDHTGTAIKRMVFAGVRVISISDGCDTARPSHKADIGFRGLMSELYLDDLRDKTHRGLTGRALKGFSAGGLPYGYVVTSTGERAICEPQAEIVRRIYDEYAAGKSSREIASRLNANDIKSARNKMWATSAIFGDTRRGIGILANPIYVGRQIWNRSKWIKHPDTGHRIRRERPSSEWITAEHPELAIVSQAAWDRVQTRMRSQRHIVVAERASGPGRTPRHLLSGLLRCGECGGPMVIVDYYRYGCATAKDRGDAACTNRLRVPKKTIEPVLLETIKRDLLSDAAFDRHQRKFAELMRRRIPDTDRAAARLRDAERVRENLLTAIKAGVLTSTTRSALVSAETDVEAATVELRTARAHQPAQMVPRARETWRRMVDALEDIRDMPAARAAIRDLLGDRIVLRESDEELVAEIASKSEISMVAGAGSVLYLTEPFRITIPRK